MTKPPKKAKQVRYPIEHKPIALRQEADEGLAGGRLLNAHFTLQNDFYLTDRTRDFVSVSGIDWSNRKVS
jgi:hypothetical protein